MPVKGDAGAKGQIAKCKGCGKVIRWTITEAGRWTPVNLDGSTHWATCSRANLFKPKKPFVQG